jgi:hypothetical protein
MLQSAARAERRGKAPGAVLPILRAVDESLRQQVLVLYLANSSLASRVVGWALYDGTGQESAETGDHPNVPYDTGLAALCAGWRLFSASQLVPAPPGSEYSTSFQKFEYWFERLVPVDGGTPLRSALDREAATAGTATAGAATAGAATGTAATGAAARARPDEGS